MPRQRQRARGTALAGGGSHNGVHRLRVADLQRARLLSAMLDMCAERGAVNVTVADVVTRAGVSRRTFYELFDDREDCLLATLDHATAELSKCVLTAYESSSARRGRWHERIRAGLIALLEFVEDEPLMGHLLIVESLSSGPRIFERRSRVLAPVIQAVDEARRTARQAGATALVAEGIVGAVLSVIHGRIVESRNESLRELANPLMSMIVLPYLGAGAARRELERQVPVRPPRSAPSRNGLKELGIRVTYRTLQVLHAIGEQPGSSNRQVALAAGIDDQGQVSKLLARLAQRGLVENTSDDRTRGTSNAWRLTERGERVYQAYR